MRAPAPAKINLALVVGPLRDDGKHELVTVYQRVGMADRIDVTPAAELRVDGFPGDSLVSGALEALAARAGVEPRWHATIDKRLPVAAGLRVGAAACERHAQRAAREQPVRGPRDLRPRRRRAKARRPA